MQIKILHVDDELDFLALTKVYLERENENFSIDTAISAEEGIELLKGGKHDVVLSDYQMPEMDGLEFLQNLRQSGSTIPFIVFTGKGREEVAMEALNRGANHYLQKGGDIKSLYGTLAHVIKDVAAKKRAEDRVEEMEKEHQIILDSVLINIFHIDANSTFVHVNEFLAKLYGKKPEDFIGKSTQELFPEEAEDYIKSDKQILKSGIPQIGTIRKIITPKGVRWVRLDKVPFKDADGNVTGIIGLAVDITKHKQAEENLRESEKDLQSIINNTWDIIFHIDLEGNYTFGNNAAEKITGYPLDKLLRMNMRELIAPEYQQFVFGRLKKRILGEPLEQPYCFEIVHKDGHRVTLELTTTSINDRSGKLIGVQGIARDISDRKQAEEEIRKSEEKIRIILDNTNDMVVYVDKYGRILDANKRVEAVMGYKRDEIVGKNFAKLGVIGLKNIPGIIKLFNDAIRTGKVVDIIELELKDKNGNKIHVEAGTQLIEKSGKTEGAVSILRDITDRKATEEKLREYRGHLEELVERRTIELRKSNELLQREINERKRAQEVLKRYQYMVESAHDAIFFKDLESHYVVANSKTLAAFGLSREEVIGKNDYEILLNREEAKNNIEDDQLVFRTGKPAEVVKQMHSAGGKDFWFQAIKVPQFDAEGNVMGLVGIARDITDRKKADEEREQLLNEIEAKNAEMERFTYTVSHDLKSPLITIQGFADMLREDLERNEKEKVESDLKHIENLATKMDHLLNDTLQLSRIGRVANPPEDVPFGEIIHEALEQTTEKMKSSGVQISVADALPTVHADCMRIVEVLVNLITNSINYMGDQLHPKIDIGYRVDGKEPVFFVKDNGIGIDKIQHEKVFELFYRADNSSKGTGAGLAIVKRIIEVHGGHIWIESAKGKGCSVCFTLPK